MIFAFGIWLYSLLFLQMAMNANYHLNHQNLQPAQTVLVLGNRAYWKQKINPCLTGRVDHALELVKHQLAQEIVMSGGLDKEDHAIESAVMEYWARKQGFAGSVYQESKSQSTLENLIYSQKLLASIPSKSVIIVSEPYHLWRTKWLVSQIGFDQQFIVQYSAAESQCWQQWGYFFKGALREPFARIHNEWRFITSRLKIIS